MANRTSLIARLRLEMADFEVSFSSTFTRDGTTTSFDLPYDNIDASSFVVKIQGGATLVAGTDYTLDAYAGRVTLTTAGTSGQVLEISGWYSEMFTDAQLGTFIDTAFSLHSANTNMVLSEVTGVEEYLIVLLAKVEAVWVLATDAAYDIDVRTVEGVTVPRSQRFAQLMALINGLKNQYKEYAEALNLGPNRIEVLTLRRVSRSTNRYVPVYTSREIDDNNMPERAYPRIDARDVVRVPKDAAEYNLIIDRTYAFAKQFTFTNDAGAAVDLTGYEFRAQVRPDKHDHKVVYLEFEVVVDNATGGVLTLKLTADQVEKLQMNHQYGWDFQWKPSGGEWDTQLRGVAMAVEENSR